MDVPQVPGEGGGYPPIAQHANEKEANSNHVTIMFRFGGDRESNGRGFRKRQDSPQPTRIAPNVHL
jgi:hypothetical protein